MEVSDTSFDPARFMATVASFGHGMVVPVGYRAHGADWVEIALDYREDLVGDVGTGVLASGPVVTLMDVACGLAIWIRQGRLVPQVTLDLRVDYPRLPVPGRTVIGRAECYRLTRRIAFVRGHAHDGDPADPIAHVAGSFMLTGSGGDG